MITFRGLKSVLNMWHWRGPHYLSPKLATVFRWQTFEIGKNRKTLAPPCFHRPLPSPTRFTSPAGRRLPLQLFSADVAVNCRACEEKGAVLSTLDAGPIAAADDARQWSKARLRVSAPQVLWSDVNFFTLRLFFFLMLNDVFWCADSRCDFKWVLLGWCCESHNF